MQMSKILINAYRREYNLKRGGTQFVEFHTNWFLGAPLLNKVERFAPGRETERKVSWCCGEEAFAAVVSQSSLQPL